MASILADAIFSLLPPSVASGAGLRDFKAWVLREDYYVKGIAESRKIELFDSTKGELGKAFRRDFAMISSTSIESFIELRRKLRDDSALAWALIKAYYSSYFAAHAIMRLHGSASIWAEHSQVASIRRVCEVWTGSAGDSPQRGGWIVTALDDLTGVRIEGAGSAVGGSHEHFWQVFCLFLDQLQQRIIDSSSLVPDAVTQSILRLQSLRAYLATGEFVRTRHEVNYKRGHGVWFPFEVPSYDDSFAARLQTRLSTSDAEIPDDFSVLSELDRAAAACRSLVSLNVELLRSIHARYPDTTEDLRVVPLRLLTQARAA